jgi:2-keto-4-pentenoate hydratase/2-oxohepta-3-ene-1,7-dioic acid hydratase in catechol pathway
LLGAPTWVELEPPLVADGAYVAFALDAAPWLGGKRTGDRHEGYDANAVGSAPRLAPVDPRKILCVGRNYRAHAKELGNEVPTEPMLFYKPPTSILDPGGAVELPPPSVSTRVEHEAELAVVVGGKLKHATEAEAREAVFGLTLACDVTARDLQKKDGQWWRAKGMDTFCPIGPVIVAGLDPSALAITCRVNGEARQRGSTADMIFSVARVLAHVSETITLEAGDVILTGTPEGVGPLASGDRVEIDIAEIGTLPFAVA